MPEVSKRVSKGDLSLRTCYAACTPIRRLVMMKKMLFQIENSRFCIRLKHTLYGLQFNGVYWKEKSEYESDPESGGQWYIYEPSIEVDKLQKLMVLFDQALYPDALISLSVKRDPFTPVAMDRFVADVLGSEFLRPSIYVVCCVLLELECRSESDGICLTGFRYVLNRHGYKLLPPMISHDVHRAEGLHLSTTRKVTKDMHHSNGCREGPFNVD